MKQIKIILILLVITLFVHTCNAQRATDEKVIESINSNYYFKYWEKKILNCEDAIINTNGWDTTNYFNGKIWGMMTEKPNMVITHYGWYIKQQYVYNNFQEKLENKFTDSYNNKTYCFSEFMILNVDATDKNLQQVYDNVRAILMQNTINTHGNVYTDQEGNIVIYERVAPYLITYATLLGE